MAPPNFNLGQRSIPSGYLVGRTSPGTGPQELLSIADVARLIVGIGVAAPPGSPSTLVPIADQRVLGNGSGAAATPVALSISQPAAGLTVAWAAGGITLALADDLAGLEAMSSTGLVTRTASNTYAQRTLTAPAAGFTISNPAGIAGNPTFALADDLAGLEALAGLGLVARTASNTYVARSIDSLTVGVTVSDGSGAAGNPTLDLGADLAALEAMSGTGLVARTASETYAQRTIAVGSAKLTISNGSGVSGNPTLDLGSVAASDLSNGVSGSGAIALVNTPTFITPVIGAATGTSLVLSSTLHVGAALAGNAGTQTIVRTSDGTGLVIARDTAGTPAELWVGISQTGLYGEIQSAQAGVGFTPTKLWLNRQGGDVAVGGSLGIGRAPTTHLDIAVSGANPTITLAGGGSVTPTFVATRAMGSIGSPTVIDAANRYLLSILGQGYDGAAYGSGAQIAIRSDGAWTGSSYPTRIEFLTVASGSTTLTERGRLHPSGGLSLGNTTDPGATNLSVTGAITGASLALSGGLGLKGAGLPLGTINAATLPSGYIIYAQGPGIYTGNLYHNSGWKYAANGSGGYVELGPSSTIAMHLGWAANNTGGAAAAAVPTAAASIYVNGDVRQGTGSAIATTATDGFLLIATCAGAPTGVPSNAGAGQIPVVFDKTNNRLYVYDGGWISAAFA